MGIIKSPNMCTETSEYTGKDEVTVCNLASINLSKFDNNEKTKFDYEAFAVATFMEIAKVEGPYLTLEVSPLLQA